MKISRNISENNKNNISCISGKVVSCADRRISASVSDGTGHFCIVTPKGIDYVPQPNDDSVVISDEKRCSSATVFAKWQCAAASTLT